MVVGEGDPYRGRWRLRHKGGRIHQVVEDQGGGVRSWAQSFAGNLASPVETVFGGNMNSRASPGKRELAIQREGMR